jgi:hypothetical protein
MDLLLVTPEEKRKIHEYYNVDEKQIKEDVMMIKSWKEKQPHLPDILTGEIFLFFTPFQMTFYFR